VRSRGRLTVRLSAAAIGVLLMELSVPAALVQSGVLPPAGERPGDAEVARAVQEVMADPNLATERTVRTLRWRDSPEQRSSGTPWWLAWIGGLFGWIAQSARVLVWCAAAVLAGMLVVFLVRLARAHRDSSQDRGFVAPTHVRDLDIRPEMLPDDIGAAARALWDRGEHRAALALLYRGLLSRLVHVHRIPIRDSSTEGDCLTLADRHLPPARREYATRLVQVWQRAVYGHEQVHASSVYPLCDEFAAAFDTRARATAPREGTA
jgi:hypothetical protein